jgi:hypothetical protein
MTSQTPDDPWLPSAEARKLGHLGACDLMHLREAGKLRFEKRGSAFFYDREDVKRIAERKSRGPTKVG